MTPLIRPGPPRLLYFFLLTPLIIAGPPKLPVIDGDHNYTRLLQAILAFD